MKLDARQQLVRTWAITDMPPTPASERSGANSPQSLADIIPDFGPEDPAYWEIRDREVAAERAVQADKDREFERKKRGELLRSDACRFPLLAIQTATALATGGSGSDGDGGGRKLTDTSALAKVKRFVTDERRALVLAGGVGSTKTTAATWFALEHGGSSPGFIRASELEARGRYDQHAAKGHDLRGWIRERSMLVIDDLGAEYMDGKSVFRSLLDEVIDVLYGDRKRLIITTNLHAAKSKDEKKARHEEPQFAERYGERISSRLHEIGRWGDCGSVDLRRGDPK
jgi:DNA replication protein DnaC